MFSASAWWRLQGVWVPELSSTCSGKIPRSPSCSCSAVPGLAPVGPVSSQSFPSYCFLESLRLQQLFPSLGLSFLREVCPSHQLPSPVPRAIQVPLISSQLLPQPLPNQPLFPCSQSGGSWLCLCSSLPTFGAPLFPCLCREGSHSQSCVVLSNITPLSRAFCISRKSNWEKGQLCKKRWKIICLFYRKI